MVRMVARLIAVALFALSLPLAAQAKTFYWISHGSPADPVWTYFLAGANSGRRTPARPSRPRSTTATSPRSRRRCAPPSPPRPTASSPPAPIPAASSRSSRKRARPDIPIINFNTPDPKVNFNAYVGGDYVVFGKALGAISRRPQAGEVRRLRLDAGRGARRELRRQEKKGIATRVQAARHHLGSHRRRRSTRRSHHRAWATTSPPTARRSRRSSASATWSTGSIKRVFDQVGVKPGEIPVVGWGNSLDTTQEVLNGYVNAAQWQDPQATSYVALSLAAMAASGIPPGFNIIDRRALREATRRRSTTRSCRASKPTRKSASRASRACAAARGRAPSTTFRPLRGARRIAALLPVTATLTQTLCSSDRHRSRGRNSARSCCSILELVGLLGDQSRFPVAAQHPQHAGLHGRTRPDRARR